jgi:hypothetical protein
MKKRRKNPNSTVVISDQEVLENAHILDGEPLLERSRAQWQLGDWGSLANLANEQLDNYSERGKLALLAAAGFAQVGNMVEMKRYVHKAKEWGCPAGLVDRVLISGLQNGLGCAKSLLVDKEEASPHFECAISMVSPQSDTRLLGRARMVQEHVQLGMLPQAMTMLQDKLSDLTTQQALSEQQVSLFQQTLTSMEAILDQEEDLTVQQIAPPQFPTEEVVAIMQDYNAGKQGLYEVISKKIQGLTPIEVVALYMGFALYFKAQKDQASELDFLTKAQDYIPAGHSALRAQIARSYLACNKPYLAFSCLTEDLLSDNTLFNKEEQKMLRKARSEGLLADSSEHGHEILISYLSKNLPEKDITPRVLIEIGTTRENIPGQSSTMKLGHFCRDHNLQFITVDMDPDNGERARSNFDKANMPFTAITAKGEDYLAGYKGSIDFVFLDAYDFDHGNHSLLRQSRYKRFLGSEIDEVQCHKMHLDCVISLVEKLTPDGIICIDDTWQDESMKWRAKGTTAVPFLLENGFELIIAKERAALFKRKKMYNANTSRAELSI